MHYLTVQDVLWIHLQIAKKPEKFSYAKLEEAVSYQYAYGKSKDPVAQAKRFLTGFANKAPFESNNRAVGFVAGVAFLSLNGFTAQLDDNNAAGWLQEVSKHAVGPTPTTTGIIRNTEDHHGTTRAILETVLISYQVAIESLIG